MKVTLRQRLKGDKITLYLDYYHQGKRNYEHLQLTLYPDPVKGKLTKEQKEENRKNLALAEAIRSKKAFGVAEWYLWLPRPGQDERQFPSLL